MDILIPYRKSKSDELRYALRSIDKFFPKSRIFISGDLPIWATGVIHLDGRKQITSYKDVFKNIERALNDSRLSDDFILWADDIYITAPIKEIPNWHEDSLETIAKQKIRQPHTKAQGEILQQTDIFLKNRGHSNPVSYALHIPMVMNKEKLVKVFEIVKPVIGKVSPRSVYGNIYAPASSCHQDVKVYTKTTPLPRPFASTWENALGKAYEELKQMYPESCKYEK